MNTTNDYAIEHYKKLEGALITRGITPAEGTGGGDLCPNLYITIGNVDLQVFTPNSDTYNIDSDEFNTYVIWLPNEQEYVGMPSGQSLAESLALIDSIVVGISLLGS